MTCNIHTKLYMKLINLLFIMFFSSSFMSKRFNYCDDSESFYKKNKGKIPSLPFEGNLKSHNLLGEGSFGKVYLINWGNDVAAVKQVKIEKHQDYIQMMDRELMFLTRIKGLQVAPELYACLETNTHIYIVQELMYNDLDAKDVMITLRKYPRVERLRKYKDLAMQYHVLHQLGITHQDIKPANIMAIDKDVTELRIIDFGLSQFVGKYVEGGSLTFNSPDKNKGIPKAQYRHDIYALAISLVILEEQKGYILPDLPKDCYDEYNKKRTCESEQADLVKETLKHSEIPELETIILKAINKSKYYTSMESLADDLEDLAQRLAIKDQIKEEMNKEAQKQIVDQAKKELAEILNNNMKLEENVKPNEKSIRVIDSFRTVFQDHEERAINVVPERKRFYRKGQNAVEEEENDSNNQKPFKRQNQNNKIQKLEENKNPYKNEFKYIPLANNNEGDNII